MDVEFKDGVNVISKKNGWGKSTLLAFIRVMLFGFDNESKRDADKNERKYYKPWNKSDVYGGTLDVEAGGKVYHLSALFGSKVSEDERQVIDTLTNSEYRSVGDKSFGEEFLLINADSFEKTAFLAHNEISQDMSDDIRAKMGNVERMKDDINNSDKASDALKSAISAIGNGKSKGKLAELNNRITELERKCNTKDTVEKTLHSLREKYNDVKKECEGLTGEISELVTRISSEGKRRESLALKDRYFEINKKISDRETRIDNLKIAFPNGIPTREDISKYREDNLECMQLKGSMDTLKLSDEEESRLISLSSIFENGVPSEEDFEKCRNDIKAIGNLEEQISKNKEKFSEKDRYFAISEKYNGNLVSPSEIDEYINMAAVRTDRAQELKALENEHAMRQLQLSKEIEKDSKQAETKKTMTFFVGFLLFVAGFCLLFAKIYPGAALIPVGAILIVVGMAIKPKEIKDEYLEEILARKEKAENAIESADREIGSFMESTGQKYVPGQAAYTLMGMKNDADEYERIGRKLEKDNTAELIEERDETAEKVRDFLDKYMAGHGDGSKDDLLNSYQELKSSVASYHQLLKKHNDYTDTVKKYRQNLMGTENFLRSHGFPVEDPDSSLKDMLDKLTKYELELEELKRETLEKTKFEEENPDYENLVNIEKSDDDISVEELDGIRLKKVNELEEKKGYLADYKIRLEEQDALLNDIEEALEERTGLLSEKEELLAKKSLYEKTKAMLEEAKQKCVLRHLIRG